MRRKIMVSNFKQLVGKYESTKANLSQQEDDIYEMCKFLNGITGEYVDGEDLSFYNPFDSPYDGSVAAIHIYRESLIVTLNYTDMYDGYDSNSKITIPKHLVDLYLNGEFIKLKEEVLRVCRIAKHQQESAAIATLKQQAEQFGYKLVKEE